MDKKFKGVHCVLYALFDNKGKLDKSAMQAQTQTMLTAGVDGITVLGLATEVQKLSPKEQRTLLSWVSEVVAGACPLSVTISGNSVETQRELIRYALDYGADWLILQPPTVGTYAGDVYLDFFIDVAQGFDVDFSIQNAPQYLGRSLNNTDIERLQQANNKFSLIKAEVSAVALAPLINTVGETMTVLNGRGGMELTDCLRAGADGFVLAPDIADISKKILDHWQVGETEKAEQLYRDILPAIVFVMQSLEHLICYGKRVFAYRAGITVYDRSPALVPTNFGNELVSLWGERLGRY